MDTWNRKRYTLGYVLSEDISWRWNRLIARRIEHRCIFPNSSNSRKSKIKDVFASMTTDRIRKRIKLFWSKNTITNRIWMISCWNVKQPMWRERKSKVKLPCGACSYRWMLFNRKWDIMGRFMWRMYSCTTAIWKSASRSIYRMLRKLNLRTTIRRWISLLQNTNVIYSKRIQTRTWQRQTSGPMVCCTIQCCMGIRSSTLGRSWSSQIKRRWRISTRFNSAWSRM